MPAVIRTVEQMLKAVREHKKLKAAAEAHRDRYQINEIYTLEDLVTLVDGADDDRRNISVGLELVEEALYLNVCGAESGILISLAQAQQLQHLLNQLFPRRIS